MRHRIRLFLLAAVVTSLAVLVYKAVQTVSLQKILEIEKTPIKLLDSLPEAALKVKDFHRTKVEGGRKVWEVAGEEARYLKAEREAVIKKPRFVFYHKNGETLEVRGNEGHLFLTDQDIEKIQLQGGIQVNYSGFVLRAHEVSYLKSGERVTSPGKVTLTGRGMELEGEGMEISLPEERILLRRNVRTKVEPEQLEGKRGVFDGGREKGL